MNDLPSRRHRLRAILVVLTLLGCIGAAVAGAGPAGADPTLPAPGQPATIEGGGRWYPRDDQGRALILHGYNIKLHGDRLDTIGAEDLVAMRRNGFTVLRMATFWTDMEPTEGVWNDEYFADLARVLDQADAAGVKVVLTMHQDSYSPAVGGYGMPDWTTRTDGLVYAGGTLPCLDPANQRAWQHFWEDPDLRQAHIDAWLEVVDRLGDKPALYGYDLLNEPCGQMNPGEGYEAALRRIEATQITPMLQRVTDAIRAEDTEHWIYLEGAYALTSSLAAPGGLGPVDDPTGRQIFAPHVYDLAMEAGLDWNPDSDFVTRYYDNIVSYGTENEVPTIVFEWGPQRPAGPDADDYARQVMEGADAHVAGWSAFAWCRGLGGWCQLDPDGNPGAGMTDNVQVYPTAVAGRPLAVGGDHAAGTSSVTVDPLESGATGPTEFYVPLRRFPTGPAVTVDLPADQWSSAWDPATQTLSVSVTSSATHTISVEPADPTVPPTSTTTSTSTTAAPTSSSTTPASTSSSSTPPAAVGPTGTEQDPGAGVAGGELPGTGADVAPQVLAALALLVGGTIAISVARRRRAPA